MLLKSEGYALSLCDPTNAYTLRRFCAEARLPYADYGAPVSLETFTQYGLSFQQRLVPAVEDVRVTALDWLSGAFELRLASGETFRAGRVVVATGLTHAAQVPAALSHLPSALMVHSECLRDPGSFKGQDVTIIGAGQSALESAALLHEAGAEVRLIVRRPSLEWNPRPIPRSRTLLERLRRPMSQLGPGLGPWFYSRAPSLFYRLPRRIRAAKVETALGPAGAWWLRDRVAGRLPIMTGHIVQRVTARGDGVLMQVQTPTGRACQLLTDRIIAATGYRFSLASLPFLSEPLSSTLRVVTNVPVLSSDFETSIPGLYFVGLASAHQFGPAMRFVHGAGYSARRVSRHIALRSGHRRSWLPLAAASSRAS